MEFKKTFSGYKDEEYETDLILWNNHKIRFTVNMHYHTFKHYWHTNYNVYYGGDKYCRLLKGESYIDKRKEARIIAFKFMKDAKIEDLESYKEAEFLKKCILESEV